MQRPTEIGELASRRKLRVGNAPEIKTPLLLPSFSSKGFPNVEKILKTMEEYISDEILISAYDVHYKALNTPLDFASAVFVDSGGYEASKDTELSETFDKEHVTKEWSPELYYEVISGWTSTSPTIFVSFDHPKYRMSTADQIIRANNLPLPPGDCGAELLLKPETETSKRLHLDRILPYVKDMGGFSAVGVTEKEIGRSVLTRMVNIARTRLALDRAGLDTPIHVFGSLDTLSTYLYFLAGADIFDGLTWLRYAFVDGDTVYRHCFGALNLPINVNSDIVEGRCWSNNYQYMQEMRLNMMKYLGDGSFRHFGKYHESIKSAFLSMGAELLGG